MMILPKWKTKKILLKICCGGDKYNVGGIYKTKFLVPGDWTVSQFSFTNRKRIEIEKETAFFFLDNGNHLIAGDDLFPNSQQRIL
jgi:hypothetical protein